MMDYRENAGYVITDSCHVGESEFVLGVHLTAPQQFVTWKCKDRTDYYWGHYFSSLFDAQKDLVARAHEEVQYLEQRGIDPNKMELEPADSPWGEILPPPLPRRLFRQHRRPWRGYGQPGACGQGALQGGQDLRLYGARLPLL